MFARELKAVASTHPWNYLLFGGGHLNAKCIHRAAFRLNFLNSRREVRRVIVLAGPTRQIVVRQTLFISTGIVHMQMHTKRKSGQGTAAAAAV